MCKKTKKIDKNKNILCFFLGTSKCSVKWFVGGWSDVGQQTKIRLPLDATYWNVFFKLLFMFISTLPRYLSITVRETALFLFLHQQVSESFFNGMFETFDSVILLYKYLSENRSLCINIYLANVMQFVSFRYKNPLSTVCIK